MKTLLLDCHLTLDWEAPWDSLQQVRWQRYQCSDGCCISSSGAYSCAFIVPVSRLRMAAHAVSFWHNIISTQAEIQARCAVCGSLSTSETQLFSAAIVLLVDLLFSTKYKNSNHSSAQLNRLMTRDKIREAIELLRMQGVAEGSPSPQDLTQNEPKPLLSEVSLLSKL